MKVKDFIALLHELPPEAPVIIAMRSKGPYGTEWHYYEPDPLYLSGSTGGGEVIIYNGEYVREAK